MEHWKKGGVQHDAGHNDASSDYSDTKLKPFEDKDLAMVSAAPSLEVDMTREVFTKHVHAVAGAIRKGVKAGLQLLLECGFA